MKQLLGLLTLVNICAEVAAFVAPASSTLQNHQSTTLLKSTKTREKSPPIDACSYHGPNCDDEYDAIVIGSGIGGLSCSSLLTQSKEKLKVLLLEQHSVAGGCCHTFQHKGYNFPTGIHYIGDMEEGSEMREMLNALTPQDDQGKRLYDDTFSS